MGKSRNKFYVAVGWQVRQIRSLNRVSQEHLGERIGVSKQTIQRYETGEIQIPVEGIAKCAKVFHTPVGFFYGEDCPPPANTNASRTGLMVAAEIMELPDDNIRRSIYQLVRSINRYEDTNNSKQD